MVGQRWVALVSVLVVIGFGLGYWFLGRRFHVGASPERFIQVLDSNGKVLESKWEPYRAPDHFDEDGLSHLKPYVQRLLDSHNWFTTISIFTPDGQHGFALWKQGGVVTANLIVEARKEPAREKRIREFFAGRSIQPSEDYMAGNGGVSDSTRVMSWPITGNADTVTSLAQRIAQELCDIPNHSGLDIQFEEQADERGKYAGLDRITIESGPVVSRRPGH
ncbi:MAG TPA: hypothetical protein VHE55_02520 [Fimbriimonadaceae bacterium]|nr:hypothetical protein [Fimbriimonadaceae bacterium]